MFSTSKDVLSIGASSLHKLFVVVLAMEILSEKAIDWMLLVAALVTSLVVFTLLMRILRTVISLVIPIAIVALVLQFAFGLSPMRLWQEAVGFSHLLWHKASALV